MRDQKWTKARICRLGYLVGLGWDAKRIAGDPLVATPPSNVHAVASRCGLSLREARKSGIHVPLALRASLDRHARARRLTPEALINRLLEAVSDRVDELVPVR